MSSPIQVPGARPQNAAITSAPRMTVGFDPITSPPTLRSDVQVPAMTPMKPSTTKILLLENVSQTAVELFEKSGYEVEFHKRALTEAELKEKVQGVHAIGIRSKTQLTQAVLAEAKDLLTIGAFCIGTNQIDLKAAAEIGVPVFNSPFSNSRSVAELTLAEVIALARQVGTRNSDLHAGVWNSESSNASEVRGKTLGIVGYGHIGSQLSVMADAFGMRVIFYDILSLMPLGSATAVSLDELLRTADFVTLHVPETPATKLMIRDEQLRQMKKGAYLINNSRGSVVDLPALAAALKSGHLAGAAVDVFPKEPKENGLGFETELKGLPNVILTPHIGGSTEEAQRAIGVEVAQAIIRYISTGSTLGAVNFPELDLPRPSVQARTARILNIHENVPGVLKQVNRSLSSFAIERQAQDSNDRIAYLVADIAYRTESEVEALQETFNAMSENIRTRILFG